MDAGVPCRGDTGEQCGSVQQVCVHRSCFLIAEKKDARSSRNEQLYLHLYIHSRGFPPPPAAAQQSIASLVFARVAMCVQLKSTRCGNTGEPAQVLARSEVKVRAVGNVERVMSAVHMCVIADL